MSIGYVKDEYWVTDDRYKAYSERDSYKNLLKAMRPAGFTFDCTYSYTSRRYHAEIITIEYFNNSAQPYIVKHNNCYDENPMHAVCKAIMAHERLTPLVAVCCMEIEAELLADAVSAARRRREAKQAALEEKLSAALHMLRKVIDLIPAELTSGDDDWHGDIPLGQAKPLPDEDDDL